MEVLQKRGGDQFILNHDFDISYLGPIGHYVQWKLGNNHWDDYNELYHATRLTNDLRQDDKVWFDTHTIERSNEIIGVVLIVGGAIINWERKYPIEMESKSLLLKYFHIKVKGQGLGSYWLNSVILPHYRNKAYSHIYINSSHPQSFPFYERFGSVIANYQQMSDNNLHKREGKCYKVIL